MEKVEKFRILNGLLKSTLEEIRINFGIVFEEKGVYTIEVYIDKDFDLREFSDRKPLSNLRELSSFCNSENEEQIEFFGLSVRNINFIAHKITLECRDKLIIKHVFPDNVGQTAIPDNAQLFFIEIEGLQMEFSDHTHKKESRGGDKNAIKYLERDFSSVHMIKNMIQYEKQYFYDEQKKNIMVQFSNEPTMMTYMDFNTFKKDYITFLSFLNGANVKIRKEYLGTYQIMSNRPFASEFEVIYSFPTLNENINHNDYIPINKHLQNVPPNILGKAFTLNFDKFCDWNSKIDLKSIIFYLNGATNTNSVEEQFFILIIAFERLTSLYAEFKGVSDLFIPNKQDFEPIKNKFLTLLKDHELIFGTNYLKVKALIGNLNEAKRRSTRDKMEGILMDFNIPIDSDIEHLINVVRNKAVHSGLVGEGLDGVKYLYLLNEILHEIILRMIDYDGERYSLVLLKDQLRRSNLPV